MATAHRMKAEDRREQLLDVGLMLFGRHGFEATSTRDIAEAAGVTDGLIYKYFATKETLLEAVLLRESQRIREETLDLPTQATPRETVSLLLIETARRMREEQALVDLLWAEGQRSREGVAHIERMNRAAFMRASAVLGELAARGAVAGDLAEFHQVIAHLAFCFVAMRRWTDDATFSAELREVAWHRAGLLLDGAGDEP